MRNGTVNLKTGELLPHRREDYLTKLAPVEYTPDARSERWERFLDQVTDGDTDLRGYLQRVAGYTLVGVATEEIMLMLFGGTATGKSTFLEALKATMGDYACTADFETLLRQNRDRGPRNDLARLQGARLVTASEVPAGRQFDEATIKQITGGDRISARFLYKEPFEYTPQFTIWLAANHRPSVREDDPAVWRRLKAVPFEKTVPDHERDPNLKAQLRDPAVGGPAILAWAVAGALQWKADGLGEPAAVSDATSEYRSEQEVFGQFVEDRCVLGDEQWVSLRGIRGAYESWSAGNGHRYTYGQKRVAAQLRARGCVPRKRGDKRGWKGIGLAAS